MPNPVFALPPYCVGPYTLRITPTAREAFSDRRLIVEHDWNKGQARIARHLGTRRALECVFRSLVTAIHYRSGLNDRSNEESYTHSLATGLVELAQNNPVFWRELNELLEREYVPGAQFALASDGVPPQGARRPPSELVYDGHRCELNWVPDALWRDPNAYGFYWLKRNKIDINAGLQGNNLALVVLHEVLHFLHEKLGLRDNTKELLFKRTQAAALPRFIQQNPQFWCWWLGAVSRGCSQSWALAA